MKIASILFILSFFLSACSEKPMLKTLNKLQPILAFGDSLTFGYGTTPQQSYPARLTALIGIPVVNAGINGELSSEGLQRLAALLDKYQPQLLLLCHGANDMLQQRDLSNMASNLTAMITLAKQRNIEVLLIAVPNTTLLLTPLKQYQQVAEKMQVPLEKNLIANILSQPSLHSDLIHPNAQGYQMMAEVIEQRLIELGAL